MQSSKVTFSHPSCTSKQTVCYGETSTKPCVNNYTCIYMCTGKNCMCCSFAGGKGILSWLDRCLTLFKQRLKWASASSSSIWESFCFVLAFSSGWWDLIFSVALISQGQWKSLGQQSRLLEGDGSTFCRTVCVCLCVCAWLRVCVWGEKTEFYDTDSKQGERNIMFPTPVVNWGQSCLCRECLQTCLCCKGLWTSRHFS